MHTLLRYYKAQRRPPGRIGGSKVCRGPLCSEPATTQISRAPCGSLWSQRESSLLLTARFTNVSAAAEVVGKTRQTGEAGKFHFENFETRKEGRCTKAAALVLPGPHAFVLPRRGVAMYSVIPFPRKQWRAQPRRPRLSDARPTL